MISFTLPLQLPHTIHQTGSSDKTMIISRNKIIINSNEKAVDKSKLFNRKKIK